MSTTPENLSQMASNAQSAAEEFVESKRPQLEKFFDDVEDLVRRVTHVSDADISRVRRRVESGLTTAKDATTRSVRATVDTTRQAARTTDDYVHSNPWTAIGAVAVAALAIGAILGNSRR